MSVLTDIIKESFGWQCLFTASRFWFRGIHPMDAVQLYEATMTTADKEGYEKAVIGFQMVEAFGKLLPLNSVRNVKAFSGHSAGPGQPIAHYLERFSFDQLEHTVFK